MSGHVQNIEGKSQVWQFAAIPIADRLCAVRDPVVIRSNDRHRAQFEQELGYTSDMIGMMVSQQNRG